MTKSRHPAVFIVPAFLFLAGCASPPVQDFREYSQAFAAARTQGDAFLDDAASAIAFAEQRDRAATGQEAAAPPYPKQFDPNQDIAGSAVAEPSSVATRRAALAVVTEYNEILVRLAEGRTGEEVSADVSSLADKVTGFAALLGGTANPLVGVGVTALSKAVALAEEQRAGAEFKRAILSGYSDVDGTIAALIDDTRSLYAIHVKRAQLEELDIRRAVNAPLNAINGLGGKFRAPKAGTDLAASHTQIESRLQAAMSQIIGPYSDPLPSASPGSGGRYDEQVDGTLSQLVAKIEDTAEHHQAVVDRVNAYYHAMKIYNGLLHQARSSLATVRIAVEAPPDSATVASNLSRSAQTLVAQVQALRDQLNVARSEI